MGGRGGGRPALRGRRWVGPPRARCGRRARALAGPRGEYQHALEEHAPLVADGTVYVETTTSISAFDCVTGEERWRVPRLNTADNLFAAARGTVYVASTFYRRYLYALDVATGVERWRVDFDLYTYWRPTLADTT